MALAGAFAPGADIPGADIPGADQPRVHRRGVARLRPSTAALDRVTVGDRIGAVVLLVLIALAVLAPIVAPYGPVAIAGLPFSPPFHAGHLLGTDEVGYDVLSRTLFGLRASIEGVALVVTSGVVIGGLVGLVAGVAGGWIDAVLMRITDVFLALPGPLLAIAFVAALGPSYFHTLIGVLVVWWPFYARIMRGEIRALRARPHLEAATLAGNGPARRAFRHLLPGAVPAIVVTASLDVGNLVITLSALSFLGLGDPAPAAELGAMSARGLQYLLQDWWVSVMPGVAIFALALTSNLAGDAASALLGDRR
jgi:peptide/nickel transport system permease protein